MNNGRDQSQWRKRNPYYKQYNKYGNKYNKYNDYRQDDAYNEYCELQEEILKVEEEFLERLPQVDPSVARQKTIKMLRTITEESVRECTQAVESATQKSEIIES